MLTESRVGGAACEQTSPESVPKAGFTTLRVFDILGREVATLVNENMNPGTFKVKLDGANLASGTYIYTLTSGEARITKKMMLLK